MVMACDAELAADNRSIQRNSEHRSVSTRHAQRQSLQDQVQMSKIEQHAGWNQRDELGTQPAEEPRSRMGLYPIPPNQPSTLPSSCFCVGEHTCPSAPGPSSAVPRAYENSSVHPTQPETDWPEDLVDENWMENFVDMNAGAVPDAEH
jgi:hypothetical protein